MSETPEAGRELDALVAEKVLGMVYTTFPNGVCPDVKHWHMPDGLFNTARSPRLPRLSTTWEGMRLVVEAMRAKGYALGMDCHIREDGTGLYDVGFYGSDGSGGVDTERIYGAESVSAPHAVCLAALRALGEDV